MPRRDGWRSFSALCPPGPPLLKPYQFGDPLTLPPRAALRAGRLIETRRTARLAPASGALSGSVTAEAGRSPSEFLTLLGPNEGNRLKKIRKLTTAIKLPVQQRVGNVWC
jgi:hypothetical protein